MCYEKKLLNYKLWGDIGWITGGSMLIFVTENVTENTQMLKAFVYENASKKLFILILNSCIYIYFLCYINLYKETQLSSW